MRVLARLACLIHAANVHSEPGSNPFGICFEQHLTPRCKQQDPRRNCQREFDSQTTYDEFFRDTPKNIAWNRTTYVQQPHQYSKADSQNHPTKLSKSFSVRRSRRPTGREVYDILGVLNVNSLGKNLWDDSELRRLRHSGGPVPRSNSAQPHGKYAGGYRVKLAVESTDIHVRPSQGLKGFPGGWSSDERGCGVTTGIEMG